MVKVKYFKTLLSFPPSGSYFNLPNRTIWYKYYTPISYCMHPFNNHKIY